MQRKLAVPLLGAMSIAIVVGVLISCGGTSGGNEDFTGTQFVADASVGSIVFSTIPSSVQVSRTAPFLVSVKDGSGSAVQQIQVSCDTEQGLALIEPTTGREMTDSYGSMSGVVGCSRPGSFQIGCRLPVGANKRVFERINCTGEIPDTFTGFPGAGGGGLGGGVQISDNAGPGGTSTEGFGITAAVLSDGTVEGTFVVDTTQVNTCGDDGTDTEPFTDAIVAFSFLNETNSSVSCSSYTLTVPSVGTFGPISLGGLTAGGVSPNGGTSTSSLLLAVAQGDGTKTWAGSSTAISASTGFKNVTFTFACNKETGDSADVGEDITLVDTLGINFSNVNRCESGGGGSSSGSASATAISFTDNGTSGATSVDVTDSNTSCGTGEVENVGDATFTMTVNNATSGTISISSYTVTISGVGSAGTITKTASLAKGTASFSGTLALGTGSAKTTIGGTTIGEVGSKSVTITLNGLDSSGDAITISATDSVNFTEVNNCG